MLKSPLPLYLIIFSGLFLFACEDTLTGDFKENQPPRTFLTVENIDLPEDQRLASRVELEWWGDDPDGYVVAYEICVGDDCDPGDTESDNWEFTESNDTTMVLPIPPGDDVADVRFSVRAIDNEGLRDPEGASVVIPIKNTPPQIRFDPTGTPPDTTYSFMSFGFIATDPDGEEDLNFYEVTANDPDNNEWVEIDPEINFITLDVNQEDVAADGTVTADLYAGRALNDTGEQISGLNLNGDNTLYIRAYDRSMDVSETAEFEWYIKEQTSNILLLNDNAGTGNVSQGLDILKTLGFNEVDVWDVSEAAVPSGNVLPTPVAPTTNQALAQWDHIYWVASRLDGNILFAVEVLSDFFENEGTVFINAPSVPVSEQDEESVFSILPTSGYETPPDGQRRFTITADADITPLIDELDTLKTTAGSASMRPMIPEGGSANLYEANFDPDAEEDFSRLISAINSDGNVLYFGFNLSNVAGPVDETLEYFLIDLLQFESN